VTCIVSHQAMNYLAALPPWWNIDCTLCPSSWWAVDGNDVCRASCKVKQLNHVSGGLFWTVNFLAF